MSILPAKSNIKLTKRLAAAADAVRGGSRAVDVGCDHGKLAAFLIVSKKCSHVIATDISPASLQKAVTLFRDCGVESKASARLTDGLNKIDGAAVDDVVIAGLGADNAASIIDRARWLADEKKRLVLVPSSRHSVLRKFLYSRGYEILRELAVNEHRHLYTVITAAYCGDGRDISAGFAAIGMINPAVADGGEHVRRVRERAADILRRTEKAKSGNIPGRREAAEIVGFVDKLLEK